MAGANGSNGSRPGTRGLPRTDADLADAVWDLCDGLRVELVKLEGLGRAISHRRVVPSTSKSWRRQFSESIRAIGQQHLSVADKIDTAG